jgi:hypothetical protein
MSTIRMEMWKKKKIEKNKENVGNTVNRKEGTNAKNRKCHCVIPKHPRL